jgi:hypothetical protein
MNLTLSFIPSNLISTGGWAAVVISCASSSDSIQKMCRAIVRSW